MRALVLVLALTPIFLLDAGAQTKRSDTAATKDFSQLYEEHQVRLEAEAARRYQQEAEGHNPILHNFVLGGIALVLLNLTAALLGFDPMKKVVPR